MQYTPCTLHTAHCTAYTIQCTYVGMDGTWSWAYFDWVCRVCMGVYMSVCWYVEMCFVFCVVSVYINATNTNYIALYCCMYVCMIITCVSPHLSACLSVHISNGLL